MYRPMVVEEEEEESFEVAFSVGTVFYSVNYGRPMELDRPLYFWDSVSVRSAIWH